MRPWNVFFINSNYSVGHPSKSEPQIINGVLFGILELREVFAPLLEICELTSCRLVSGYWISESNNGNWWAERLKEKFLQAVAIYVVGEVEKPGSQTDGPMINALRNSSPHPPPGGDIVPPAKNTGQMDWPSLLLFDKLEASDPIGLDGENQPSSTSENSEFPSTLSSEVFNE